ncbi:MAG: acyl-CoA thioesterase [Acidimicrobiales bacterium]
MIGGYLPDRSPARGTRPVRAPAYYREELVCASRVRFVGRTSITFDQVIWRPGDGVTIAGASAVVVTTGPTGRPEPVPERWRRRMAVWEGRSLDVAPAGGPAVPFQGAGVQRGARRAGREGSQ